MPIYIKYRLELPADTQHHDADGRILANPNIYRQLPISNANSHTQRQMTKSFLATGFNHPNPMGRGQPVAGKGPMSTEYAVENLSDAVCTLASGEKGQTARTSSK